MKNIKKALVVVCVVCLSAIADGQAPFPSPDEIKQFSSSTTCVVFEESTFSAFNAYIKDAMDDYWEITPFEFIDRDEFNTRKNDPSFSFILLTETVFEKDRSNTTYNFINLIQGKKVGSLAENPEICAVPLSSSSEDDFDFGYKLGAVLSFMQQHARLILEDPSKTGMRYLKYYNVNVPDVQGRTILVRKEDLSPALSTIEQIRDIYSGRIEIVSEEEIVKAIEEKRANTVILHEVSPADDDQGQGICFKMLIGTDNARMYYYNEHNINSRNPGGLLPSDLRRLARFN